MSETDASAAAVPPVKAEESNGAAAAADAAAAAEGAKMEDVKPKVEAEDAEGEDAAAAAGESTPKKARKPRVKAEPAAAAAAAAPVSAGVSQRGRERKQVQAFVPPTPTKEVEEFVIEKGVGTPLGDIENVKRRMDTINAQDDTLKAAFHACFPNWKGRGGNTKDVIKKNLRAFSGYVKGQQSELAASATERLERYHGDVLKHVCQLLDISESGAKAKMIEHITEFLKNPVASGHAYKGGSASAGSKRKSSGSAKKKGDKEDKPKRRPGAYFLFLSEHRERVTRENPGLKVTEISKKVGELWRALSDAKKQQYKERAMSGKETVSGSESDSGSESESEEEEEEPAPKAKKAKKAAPAAAAAAAAPVLSAEWSAKFGSSLDALLKDADLTALSMKNLLTKLTDEHGELVVEANKAALKNLVISKIQQKTAAQ